MGICHIVLILMVQHLPIVHNDVILIIKLIKLDRTIYEFFPIGPRKNLFYKAPNPQKGQLIREVLRYLYYKLTCGHWTRHFTVNKLLILIQLYQ